MKNIEVILLENIKNLGKKDSIIKVKPGYAKNFLLKKKKVIRATKQNISHITQQQKEIANKKQENRKNAILDLKLLKNKIITYIVKTSKEGKLYGAIPKKDIIEKIQKFDLSSKNIDIIAIKNIKNVGIFNIKISLYADITFTIKLIVARDKNEADNILSQHNNNEDNEGKNKR